MCPPAPCSDLALELRDVALTLRAGVPCCRAAARVFVGLDLIVRHGERVLVVDLPRDVGTLLLLVAAELLRPSRGRVWTVPGARLVRAEVGACRAVRGVAEGAARSREALRWAGRGAGGAELAVGGACDDIATTRVLRYRAGRLHAVPAPGRRVDSASGAP